jgi:hypothetical protein
MLNLQYNIEIEPSLGRFLINSARQNFLTQDNENTSVSATNTYRHTEKKSQDAMTIRDDAVIMVTKNNFRDVHRFTSQKLLLVVVVPGEDDRGC